MEFPETDYDPPAPRPRPSMIPSWVMLGFALGALFVWLLPDDRPVPPPPEPERIVVREAPMLLAVEGLFQKWGQHAVWDDDVTEIAAWNIEAREFIDYFEVRRVRLPGTDSYQYYFRSLDALTRSVFTRGVPSESLLRFTESREARQRTLDAQLGGQIRRLLIGNDGSAAGTAEPPPAIDKAAPPAVK